MATETVCSTEQAAILEFTPWIGDPMELMPDAGRETSEASRIELERSVKN